MSDAPPSLAFFDPVQSVHGALRAGASLLFEGQTASSVAAGPEIDRRGDGWHARLEGRLDLEFAPVAEPARQPGATTAICNVTGEALGRRLDCLGTATETATAPAWRELDAVRALSALFDPETAVLAVARRPRGVPGHGAELVTAHLVRGGELLAVDQARISTVYDGDGRQRTAGLELWLPAEDFPRRLSGSARAGASLSIDGLRVDSAIFSWRMEGREGAGAYEIVTHGERAAA